MKYLIIFLFLIISSAYSSDCDFSSNPYSGLFKFDFPSLEDSYVEEKSSQLEVVICAYDDLDQYYCYSLDGYTNDNAYYYYD